ncbi:aminotransferase [Limosilactobacillus fermentum]
MKIKDFGVEQWMNEYETKAKYNLGETCVSSLSIRELCELVGVDVNDFAKQLVDRRLTYGAIEGAVELKEAITRLYQNLTPDEIVTEHGAIGANNLVLNALVEPGDEVIAVTPTYQQLQSIPKAIGAMVKLLPLKRENGYLPDAEQLRGLVSDKTKLIVLNNPDNPTGALMSQAGLQTIVDIAKSVDAYVLCDEVYRHLTQEDGYSPSIIDLYDKGISTSSFSKVFSLAGIRLGWLATHDQAVMKACLSYRDYETISCGQLDEMVGTLALKNQAVLLERNRGIVRENLKVLEEWVHQQPHITWLKPKVGTTALLYYDFDLPSTIFCDRLMKEYETLLVPGSCFDIENSLRIGYAFETTHLRDGMNQLGKFLAKLE